MPPLLVLLVPALGCRQLALCCSSGPARGLSAALLLLLLSTVLVGLLVLPPLLRARALVADALRLMADAIADAALAKLSTPWLTFRPASPDDLLPLLSATPSSLLPLRPTLPPGCCCGLLPLPPFLPAPAGAVPVGAALVLLLLLLSPPLPAVALVALLLLLLPLLP
jgi:hypothetical protein